MADQLLDQARELAEGQIVCSHSPMPTSVSIVVLTAAGFRGSETRGAARNCFACNGRGNKKPPACYLSITNMAQAISFIVGFFLQDIKLALYIGLGGTALTFLLIVPPWPFFNKHPVKWLPVAGNETKSQGILVDGQIVG